jgi:hypothetical protein
MPAHRISRPLFARFYARVSPAMDAAGMAARRQQLLEGQPHLASTEPHGLSRGVRRPGARLGA